MGMHIIKQIPYESLNMLFRKKSEGHNEQFINLILTQSPAYFLLAKHDMMTQRFFVFVPFQGEVSEQ